MTAYKNFEQAKDSNTSGRQLRAALYCRLSREDREKPQPGQESRSIQNQRSLLLDYAAQQGWQVREIYVDEDYSGSDRLRPAFCRMLEDAEKGAFDILLCKSQSRFTRELELVEKYIHGCFVDWRIRFIGVADHVDTAQQQGRKARQLSGLINEWYLEDLSDSIRSVLRSHQRQGRHIGSFAPYGYRKDPEQGGHLLVDTEAAAVVQRIFRLYSQGMGKTAIASLLNQEQVPTPSRYKELQGSRYRCKYGLDNSGLWRYNTVSALLENPVYQGTVVQHRSEKRSYKSKKVDALPKEQWILVPHCHEALIEPPLWEAVQGRLLMQKGKRESSGGRVGLFAGKLHCLYCGQSLRRCHAKGEQWYYRCAGAQVHSGCVGAFLSHRELCQKLLETLKQKRTEPLWQQNAVNRLGREDAAAFSQWLEQEIADFQTESLPKWLDILLLEIRAGRRDPKSRQVPIEFHWRF